MKNREIFHSEIYKLLKNSIENIDKDLADDIYALWFWCTEIDPYPSIVVRCMTLKHFKIQLENPDKELFEWYIQRNNPIDNQLIKWNCDFCNTDNNIANLYLEDCKTFIDWINQSTTYISSEEFNNLREVDRELYLEKESKISNFFYNCFIEEIILIVNKLFENGIIKSKFHINIPIIIDQYTYNYEETIDWTTRANPKDVADEFIKWALKQ